MISKYLDQLRWWLRGPTNQDDSAAPPTQRVNTELSATVFSGEASVWVAYLNQARRHRYDSRFMVRVIWSDEKRKINFHPLNDDSSDLAGCLNACFTIARRRAEKKPFVATALDELVFGNSSNGDTEIHIRLSDTIPTDASREVSLARGRGRNEGHVRWRSLTSPQIRRLRLCCWPGLVSANGLDISSPLRTAA